MARHELAQPVRRPDHGDAVEGAAEFPRIVVGEPDDVHGRPLIVQGLAQELLGGLARPDDQGALALRRLHGELALAHVAHGQARASQEENHNEPVEHEHRAWHLPDKLGERARTREGE